MNLIQNWNRKAEVLFIKFTPDRWKIYVEVPPSGILSLTAQRGRCRTSQLQDYRVHEYRLPSPPSFKCNVLRESLSVDNQNIPCATLKKRGAWVISVYLWLTPVVHFRVLVATSAYVGFRLERSKINSWKDVEKLASFRRRLGGGLAGFVNWTVFHKQSHMCVWFTVQHVVRATPRADINSRQSKEGEEGVEGRGC